ncbi:hypothetical protein [Dysgonomonas sp. 520]|uniref:hypothetical protein n=1 Tax=Dysgonomonas sp. 520 TaxID=2302931 RepID=UPI0013D11BA7|nr:hypothetical protein [Dysgonomonas sp. 520]NDW09686.1 hypothetical protein [Dysgonomonas sp. 520]
MKKTLLAFTALFGIAVLANAQFRFSDGDATKLERGVSLTTDPVTGDVTALVHFNTNKTSTVASGSSKQTINGTRGQLINVYNENSAVTWPKGNESRLNNINQNNNVIMADSLGCFLDYYTAVDKPAMSADHGFWYPANVYFLKDKTLAAGVTDRTTLAEADRVFAIYPGMYKKYGAMFAFDLSGLSPTSDIEFEMYTYDDGNTGKTATYDLWIGIGNNAGITSNNIDTTKMTVVRNVYTSGEAMKTVKLAEAFGKNISELSKNKVYFAITTSGTGEAMNPMKYDPIIAFDNFKVTYSAPTWLNPASTLWNERSEYRNTDPIENVAVSAGEKAVFYVELEMKNRVVDLTVDLDKLEGASPETAMLRAVGAQAWVDNAWVDIAGVNVTPATQSATDGTWSKERLTIPASTNVQEKIRLVLNHEVKAADINGATFENRFELNNGVRFYYDVNAKLNLASSSLVSESVENISIYSAESKIFVKNAANNVTVYSTDGKAVRSVSKAAAAKGISVESGAYIVSTGKMTEKVIVK